MSLQDQIASLKKFSLDDLYNTFLGLDRQGQILSVIGSVVLLLFLIIAPIAIVSTTLGEIEAQYDNEIAKASEIFGVLNQYKSLKKNFEKVERSFGKNKNVLQDQLYNLAQSTGIPNSSIEVKTKNMPSTDVYEEIGKDVSVKKVPYDQFLGLLNKIENNDELPMMLKNIKIKIDSRKRGTVKSAKFTVSTIRLKQGNGKKSSTRSTRSRRGRRR